MTKKEMIHAISQATGLSLKEAEGAFTAMVDIITKEITTEEKAAVSGLGTFEVRGRSARKGRNFQTGEAVKIPSSKSVGFRAGKNLKEAINR
ncbi:MAG: HU family DNA-binding protein [Clostridia bacterium]|nr:HU family DNA-binding protein [Clostridia bacterium]